MRLFNKFFYILNIFFVAQLFCPDIGGDFASFVDALGKFQTSMANARENFSPEEEIKKFFEKEDNKKDFCALAVGFKDLFRLAVNDVLGPDGQKSEAFVTFLNSGVSGLSDALSGQPGADLAKSAANLTQNTLDAFSTALADDPDLIKNCIDKFLPMVQNTFESIGGAAGAGVEGAAEGFGEGLVRASKVVWNKAAKIGEESGEGFADTAGSFFKMAREGSVQNPFRGMFSGPRERGPGGRLRVNATRDVLILVGAGATLVTIGVGTPVAGVYASYKCVQLVSEKIKRKMFYPKILEYLEPYEKDFSLSDVQGSKEFKNKLYTLVANIKAAAKNNEEINPITFFGEAGVGKTLMAKVVGAEMEKLGYRFVRFNITSLKDCHNPEDEVRRVFELTRKKKWILFIDEADQLLFLNRNSQKLNDKSRSLMMKVMEVTGGKMSGKFEGLILCSTNNLADVDEPMLQRFASKVIVFPKPDVDVVKQILQKNIQEQLFASLPVSRLQKICRFVTRKKPIFRNFEEGCFSLEHLDFLANKMLENKFSGRLIENYVSAIKTETGNTLFVNKELVDVCLDEAIASSAARGNLSERA